MLLAPRPWVHLASERSSLPSKNFPCISMDMLQIGALVLLGRLVEACLFFFFAQGVEYCPWAVYT